MVPFRVYDKENKVMWIVLNFHPNGEHGGTYLLAREDDSDEDGEMKVLQASEITGLRFVDFLDEGGDYGV